MASILQWFAGIWSKAQQVADMSLSDIPTAESKPADHCHLFVDALDELLKQADKQNAEIGDMLERLYKCRKTSESFDPDDKIGRALIQSQRKGWEATEAFKAVAISLKYHGETIPILTPEQVID